MKLNHLIAVSAIIISALSSCKKDASISNDNPASNGEKMLVKTVFDNDTYTYEYTSDKKLKSYTYGNGHGKITFEYQPNLLTNMVFIDNVSKGVLKFELVNGICQRLTGTYYDGNGNISDEYITDYIYNAKGLLDKESYTKNGNYDGYTTHTYDANNEVQKKVSVDKNGIPYRTAEFEYDAALPEKAGPISQFYAGGTAYLFPKMANHLIKKKTVTDNSGVSVYTYARTMDAQGYVLTEKLKDAADVILGTLTNTWQ
jgi:hypothetical protein